MQINQVAKEEFVSWKNDPVTKAVLDTIKLERESAKEMIVQGRFKGDELQQVIGFCVGLYNIINLEYEEAQDAESVSVEGSSQA